MKKQRKISGAALFMYSTIVLTAIMAATCFTLYYGKIFTHAAILWTGITTFMILFHFGLRILLGEVTKHLKIDYRHPWFRRRGFEKALFRLLRVRQWKDKVLTFDTAAYDFENRTPAQLAATMAKSETDHWINEGISLVSMLFALVWGQTAIFVGTAILAMLFDAQFIIVQRYNRPIVLRLMEKQQNAKQKIKAH